MSGRAIVHQFPPSPYAEILRRVLVQLEIPFDVRDYLPVTAEQEAELHALQARAHHAQLPILERHGEFYGDSFLITKMLVEEQPALAARIYPPDPVTRAVVSAFQTSADGWWLRPEGQHFTEEYRAMKGEAEAARILAKDHQMRHIVLTTWDAMLAQRPFLAGEAYTMADIAVVSHLNANISIAKFVHSAVEEGIEVPFDVELWPRWELDPEAYPHLRRWFDRCNAREFTESPVPAT